MVSGTVESGSLALGLGARSSQPKSTARESLAAPLMRGQGQTDEKISLVDRHFYMTKSVGLIPLIIF
jgi:hypothetical protein